MEINDAALLTIVLMALVTYATRAGGFWLAGKLVISRRVENWLSYLPGTVLVSLVVPGVLTGGLAGALAGLITVLVALKTQQLLPAMLAGVLVVWFLRAFFHFA